MKEKSIILSQKHGVNPSVTRCICCGKEYGVALLGKLNGDEEAPREIYQGLCNECQAVVDQGGVLIIEVREGEQGKSNPFRTGRVIGCSKAFKERNCIESSLIYMEQIMFSNIFSEAFVTQNL